MSLGFRSTQHADSRDDARLLVEQARDHQPRADVAGAVAQTLTVHTRRPAANNALLERGLSMDTKGIAQHTAALNGVNDEDAAAASDAKLLITAPGPVLVEALARRVHAAGGRAALPFVQTRGCDFPIDRQLLGATCSQLLETAAGGSLLISNVEEMPRIVQDMLIELLSDLERARTPLPSVRLISGTTVSLLDRTVAGTFSDRLFYRLNTIHLVTDNGSGATQPA
jgi:DNA-binding NtrC family response regulator